MRVLTMNVFGFHRDWHERQSVLSRGLGELAPDIATFQEAILADGHDQPRDLLGRDYHILHQRGQSEEGVGAAIASRWPFEVVREMDLRDADRGDAIGWIGSLAVVEVAVPEPIGPVLLIHHKPTWQSGRELERERQAVASARIVEELLGGTDRHVILAGDFDATPDAASIRFWSGRQSLDGMSVYYQDAWAALHPDEPGHTFTPDNALRSDSWKPRPGRRIDYVMVRCGDHGATLDITACNLAFDRPVDGVWASDHFGVWADFAPAPASGDPA